MAKSEMELIQLLLKLIGHKTGDDISKLEFYPQKVSFPESTEGESRLPRSTPEQMGVDSMFLYELFSNLFEQNNCHMHKVMAVRKGHVIGECAFYPFDMDTWHITHSMCKSVTGMAIGFLVSEGKLSVNDKISDIFGSSKSPLKILFSNNMTVEHLLTMTSSSPFNEAGTITGNDWKKLFLDAQPKGTPGAEFEYNSMNSYMLSAIVTEITGENMLDYLRPRLFDPLGIKRVYWENCPQKIAKGGWGMYLRMEDMAKLGQLYLNLGEYNGKQILPKEWVKESTRAHIETGQDASPGYGYQMWTNSAREGAYTFNGMLGQNVYVFPDVDMMIITNAANEDLFQEGNMSKIIHSHMSKIETHDEPIPEGEDVIKNQKRLWAFIKYAEGDLDAINTVPSGGWGLRKNRMSVGKSRTRTVTSPIRKEKSLYDAYNCNGAMNPQLRRILMKNLNGVSYDMDDQGVGIMPLLMQIMHNNYTDGIRNIGFKYDDRSGAFYLVIKEGEKQHEIKCGFDKSRAITDLDEHGEINRVATVSEFSTDEYGRAVLRNEFYFLEDSTTRVMNIYFGKREPLEHAGGFNAGDFAPPVNIGVRFDEVPGSGMLFGVLDMYGTGAEFKGINGIVYNKLNDFGAMDALYLAIKDTVRPKLHGSIHFENNDAPGVGKSTDLGYDIHNDENDVITEEY
ncbi:MAG: beta-lactamase family protein [Butyrivibrio sp.]|nr:beta-lactamase family protein [Butyrivibrio sp.]